MIINLSFIGNVKEKPKSVDRLMKFISKDSNFSRDLLCSQRSIYGAARLKRKKIKENFNVFLSIFRGFFRPVESINCYRRVKLFN
jgi:hypothetical protein